MAKCEGCRKRDDKIRLLKLRLKLVEAQLKGESEGRAYWYAAFIETVRKDSGLTRAVNDGTLRVGAHEGELTNEEEC